MSSIRRRAAPAYAAPISSSKASVALIGLGRDGDCWTALVKMKALRHFVPSRCGTGCIIRGVTDFAAMSDAGASCIAKSWTELFSASVAPDRQSLAQASTDGTQKFLLRMAGWAGGRDRPYSGKPSAARCASRPRSAAR